MAPVGRAGGFVREFVHGPAIWLVPVLAGWCLSAGIVITPKTDIMQDYFASVAPHIASQRGGRDVQQGICPSEPTPQNAERCAAGAAASVDVTSYTSAAGALVSFLVTPGLGRISDELGRRPFVLGGFVLPLLGHVCLAWYYSSVRRGWPAYVDLWAYLGLSALGFSIPISMSLSYFADSFSPHNRAAGFGVVLFTFSAAIIIGPKLGTFLPVEVALWAAVGINALGLLAGALFLPETLSAERRALARAHAPGRRARVRDFVDAASILGRDRFFAVLAAVAATDGVALQGMQDVSLFYLKETLGFDDGARGALLECVGFGGLIVQALLLKPLVACIRERGTLLLGLGCTWALICTYALVGQLRTSGRIGPGGASAAVFAVIVPAQALAGVTFPAISALKANHAHSEEQGQVQGALSGARSLATGAGPLLTAWLWRALPGRQYLVYYVLASFVLLALALAALTLPRARALPGATRLKEPLLDAAAEEEAGRPSGVHSRLDAGAGGMRASASEPSLRTGSDASEEDADLALSIGVSVGHGAGMGAAPHTASMSRIAVAPVRCSRSSPGA